MQETKTDFGNLNENQREAVVSNHKRLLVLAGAGSGKTKTLLQKLVYLIEEKGVSPASILAITFTKNAASEMLDRLIIAADDSGKYADILTNKNKSQREKDTERYFYTKKYRWINNLNLKTFHALCYSIIRNFGVNEFDNRFKIIENTKATGGETGKYTATETAFEVIHKILIEKCASNQYLLHFKRYVLDYMVDKVDIDKARKALPAKDGKFFTALNGTRVRSKSEQYIADWLYRHSIGFEYEPRINFRDFDFRPDFFIPEANLYIEHVSDKSHPMESKEHQFKLANKLLVKTFETQTKDTAIFNLVLERVVKSRLPANYQFTTALSFEEEFRTYHKEVKNFLRQVMRVIDMIKIENMPVAEVLNNSQKDQHQRVRDFYQLAAPVIDRYKAYCINRSYLDFNDMIIRTISLFRNHQEIVGKFKGKYQYILVDEFQDVNNLQVELLKLLLTEETQLFCVGDDWQSIYGFRGSNVGYILNFTQHFPGAETITLSLNYRSTPHIVSASNEVIKHNKFRIDKHIEAFRKSESKIFVYAGKEEDENVDFAVKEVKRLQREKGYLRDDILFLYRRSKMYFPYFERFRKEGIFVSGKTIHASKGLEAKAVFIIGLSEGKGGFPDIWQDDRIYHAIRSFRYEMLKEEERRLFYVAITRAQDELFLLTEKGNESSFLKEIPDTFTHKSGIPFKPMVERMLLCDRCKNAVDQDSRFCKYCGSAIREGDF